MIRKWMLSLCVLLSLTACSVVGENHLAASSLSPSSIKNAESNTTESTAKNEDAAVYAPAHPLTAKETVEEYFKQQYSAYTSLKYTDISYLLDMNQVSNRNALVWLQTLIQRRRLISQQALCYVDTAGYPYSITYQENAENDRMDFWSKRGMVNSGAVAVHFTITGEKGRAYPPLMAMNAQHTMFLTQVSGVWKISFHYFPGSVRRFNQSTELVLPSEKEMLEDLTEEFSALSSGSSAAAQALPAGADAYTGTQAAAYAKYYTESPNPAFYDIGDWMGNCANFISQCIWYGFATNDHPNIARSENMAAKWYAGSGGGSPAWENVGKFWDYVTTPRGAQKEGLHGDVVQSISQLELGGIIQVRTGRFHHGENDESFNHSLLMVDKPTMLFAQNSPDCFVYYSDLINVDARYYNPKYLVE